MSDFAAVSFLSAFCTAYSVISVYDSSGLPQIGYFVPTLLCLTVRKETLHSPAATRAVKPLVLHCMCALALRWSVDVRLKRCPRDAVNICRM